MRNMYYVKTVMSCNNGVVLASTGFGYQSVATVDGIASTSNVFAQANTACLVSRLLGRALIPHRNGDLYGKRDITKIHDI